MLHVVASIAYCAVLLGVVAQSLKLVKRLAQQCWDLLRPFSRYPSVRGMTHSQMVKLALKEKEFSLSSLPILNNYWMTFW